ncbi:hypothetical protein B484DRAFT_436184, partial [Ochromonadaceae sp. CCMP2298]
MTEIVNIAAVDRTPDDEDCPDHRRFPVPQEGDCSPHISEIAASAMTVSTLASCCALSLQSWLTDNCLPEEFLDISKFPDALVRPDRPVDSNDWFDAVNDMYIHLHRVYRQGITAESLQAIFDAYTDGEPQSIAPIDARRFLQNADPANYAYISVESAPAILLALFVHARQYSIMCPAHLNHYFPGPWLQCVEFWMGCEHPGIPFYQDNLPPTTSRAVAMERILTRSRLLVFRDWMPLQRILSRREVPYGVYFYYAANVEFRKLYPNFLRKTWCEQAQMCLTFWGTTHLHTNAHIRHLDRAGATSEEFIIAQTFLGGCYPLPVGSQPLDEDRAFSAPRHNYVEALQAEGCPQFLFLNTPWVLTESMFRD